MPHFLCLILVVKQVTNIDSESRGWRLDSSSQEGVAKDFLPSLNYHTEIEMIIIAQTPHFRDTDTKAWSFDVTSL